MRIAGALVTPIMSALVVSVAGCGSSSSSPQTATPQPTISGTLTFRNNTEGYAFSFPANWHFGPPRTVQGVYVQPITIPLSKAQVQVRVQRNKVSYAALTGGKKIKSNGVTLTYRHVTMAGRPAIEIDTNAKAGASQIVTIVNGPKLTYTVSVSTPSPPLEPRTVFGYRQVVSTFKAF